MIYPEDCIKAGWAYGIYTGPDGNVKFGHLEKEWIRNRPTCVPVNEIERDDFKCLATGTVLKLLLKRDGFKGCPDCVKLANKMDIKGSDWCRREFDTLIEQMVVNARLLKGLEGVRAAMQRKVAQKTPDFVIKTYLSMRLQEAIDRTT